MRFLMVSMFSSYHLLLFSLHTSIRSTYPYMLSLSFYRTLTPLRLPPYHFLLTNIELLRMVIHLSCIVSRPVRCLSRPHRQLDGVLLKYWLSFGFFWVFFGSFEVCWSAVSLSTFVYEIAKKSQQTKPTAREKYKGNSFSHGTYLHIIAVVLFYSHSLLMFVHYPVSRRAMFLSLLSSRHLSAVSHLREKWQGLC